MTRAPVETPEQCHAVNVRKEAIQINDDTKPYESKKTTVTMINIQQ